MHGPSCGCLACVTGKARSRPPGAFQRRSRTVHGRLSPEERSAAPATDYDRPKTRGECGDVPRPCPYVACRHNLYLDVGDTGNIKLNFPGLEPGDMEESCALDIADRGGSILDEVGTLLNVTRERARQMELEALERLTLKVRKITR